MKRFNSVVALALMAISTAVAVLVPVAVFAGTANCFDWDNRGTCVDGAGGCQIYDTISPAAYCKQLCVPYVDPGCCFYSVTKDYWTSVDPGTCPCASSSPTTTIYGATNSPSAICWAGTSAAPCNTDVHGACVLAP
jgi:hypothetical protein